ncbi:hypothetical protein ADUPG1_011827, partial [Aduncisulcus paluster]
ADDEYCLVSSVDDDAIRVRVRAYALKLVLKGMTVFGREKRKEMEQQKAQLKEKSETNSSSEKKEDESEKKEVVENVKLPESSAPTHNYIVQPLLPFPVSLPLSLIDSLLPRLSAASSTSESCCVLCVSIIEEFVLQLRQCEYEPVDGQGTYSYDRGEVDEGEDCISGGWKVSHAILARVCVAITCIIFPPLLTLASADKGTFLTSVPPSDYLREQVYSLCERKEPMNGICLPFSSYRDSPSVVDARFHCTFLWPLSSVMRTRVAMSIMSSFERLLSIRSQHGDIPIAVSAMLLSADSQCGMVNVCMSLCRVLGRLSAPHVVTEALCLCGIRTLGLLLGGAKCVYDKFYSSNSPPSTLTSPTQTTDGYHTSGRSQPDVFTQKRVLWETLRRLVAKEIKGAEFAPFLGDSPEEVGRMAACCPIIPASCLFAILAKDKKAKTAMHFYSSIMRGCIETPGGSLTLIQAFRHCMCRAQLNGEGQAIERVSEKIARAVAMNVHPKDPTHEKPDEFVLEENTDEDVLGRPNTLPSSDAVYVLIMALIMVQSMSTGTKKITLHDFKSMLSASEHFWEYSEPGLDAAHKCLSLHTFVLSSPAARVAGLGLGTLAAVPANLLPTTHQSVAASAAEGMLLECRICSLNSPSKWYDAACAARGVSLTCAASLHGVCRCVYNVCNDLTRPGIGVFLQCVWDAADQIFGRRAAFLRDRVCISFLLGFFARIAHSDPSIEHILLRDSINQQCVVTSCFVRAASMCKTMSVQGWEEMCVAMALCLVCGYVDKNAMGVLGDLEETAGSGSRDGLFNMMSSSGSNGSTLGIASTSHGDEPPLSKGMQSKVPDTPSKSSAMSLTTSSKHPPLPSLTASLQLFLMRAVGVRGKEEVKRMSEGLVRCVLCVCEEKKIEPKLPKSPKEDDADSAVKTDRGSVDLKDKSTISASGIVTPPQTPTPSTDGTSAGKEETNHKEEDGKSQELHDEGEKADDTISVHSSTVIRPNKPAASPSSKSGSSFATALLPRILRPSAHSVVMSLLPFGYVGAEALCVALKGHVSDDNTTVHTGVKGKGRALATKALLFLSRLSLSVPNAHSNCSILAQVCEYIGVVCEYGEVEGIYDLLERLVSLLPPLTEKPESTETKASDTDTTVDSHDKSVDSCDFSTILSLRTKLWKYILSLISQHNPAYMSRLLDLLFKQDLLSSMSSPLVLKCMQESASFHRETFLISRLNVTSDEWMERIEICGINFVPSIEDVSSLPVSVVAYPLQQSQAWTYVSWYAHSLLEKRVKHTSMTSMEDGQVLKFPVVVSLFDPDLPSLKPCAPLPTSSMVSTSFTCHISPSLYPPLSLLTQLACHGHIRSLEYVRSSLLKIPAEWKRRTDGSSVIVGMDLKVALFSLQYVAWPVLLVASASPSFTAKHTRIVTQIVGDTTQLFSQILDKLCSVESCVATTVDQERVLLCQIIGVQLIVLLREIANTASDGDLQTLCIQKAAILALIGGERMEEPMGTDGDDDQLVPWLFSIPGCEENLREVLGV